MPKLVLKVAVSTLLGTRLGVPNLIALFQKHSVRATFLFSLGPDNTGKAIKRVFQPGFFADIKRARITHQYNVPTLLYGTLLPAPDIGNQTRDTLRATRDAGFECGIQGWDRVQWQDHVHRASNNWIESQIQRAIARFTEIFETAPKVHGAARWQMNPHALRCMQKFGLLVGSDSRGAFPYLPLVKGEPVRVAQFPTTLSPLDEIIGVNGLTTRTVAAHLLSLTETEKRDHVFTLRAEVEGMAFIDTLDALITGWQLQGYDVCALETLVAATPRERLPYCNVDWVSASPSARPLLTQGKTVVPSPAP